MATVLVVEHFLLPDLVVLRTVDAEQFDDEQRPDLVLGGLPMRAMAQFRVANWRCRAGVADATTASPIGPQAAAPTDLRRRAPAAVELGGVPLGLWQLPEWRVDSRTVLHLVLVSDGRQPVSREVHRELLGALHVEHGDAHVLPASMGTFGGDGMIQCMAEFSGQFTGLRASIDPTLRGGT